jgi:hypothetical protein
VFSETHSLAPFKDAAGSNLKDLKGMSDFAPAELFCGHGFVGNPLILRPS